MKSKLFDAPPVFFKVVILRLEGAAMIVPIDVTILARSLKDFYVAKQVQTRD